MRYWKGTTGDYVVQADNYEDAVKFIDRRILAGVVPILSVEEVDMEPSEAEDYGTLGEPEGPWIGIEVLGLLVQGAHIFWKEEDAEEWFKEFTEGLTPDTLYDEDGNCVNDEYDQCKIFTLASPRWKFE